LAIYYIAFSISITNAGENTRTASQSYTVFNLIEQGSLSL